MKTQGKYVAIVALVTAFTMLYLIKPAPANAWCSDWGDNLNDRFTANENKPSHTDQDVNEWFTLKRESISYEIICTDITVFF